MEKTGGGIEDLRKTILLVDDDYAMRHILRSILRQLGDFRFFEAENGMKAIELMEENLPDLVFLDIIMPILNGIETLQYMKKIQVLEKIQVIVCTAEGNLKTVQQAIDLGAKDFIRKPFNMDTVLVKARKWLQD